MLAKFARKARKRRESLDRAGQQRLELFPETETGFFFEEVDAQITFVKDDKGQVTHAMLHQNKVDQQAKKIK